MTARPEEGEPQNTAPALGQPGRHKRAEREPCKTHWCTATHQMVERFNGGENEHDAKDLGTDDAVEN